MRIKHSINGDPKIYFLILEYGSRSQRYYIIVNFIRDRGYNNKENPHATVCLRSNDNKRIENSLISHCKSPLICSTYFSEAHERVIKVDQKIYNA